MEGANPLLKYADALSRKAIFLLGIFFAALTVFAGLTFSDYRANAQQSVVDVRGVAWSSTIGWINFNCVDTLSCGSSSYRVQYNQDTGELSGYAWSSNVGWISFNKSDVGGNDNSCPVAPCTAKVDDGELEGFARVLAAEERLNDGWDGWIRLSGSNYGVNFDGTAFTGYAWGGGDTVSHADGEAIVGIGWVDFSPSRGPGVFVEGDLIVETGVESGGGTSFVRISGDTCSSASCFFGYERDTVVTLTANPGEGLVFDRWLGADSSKCGDVNSRVCGNVLVDDDLQIKARFMSVNCPEDGELGVCPVCNDGKDNDEDGFYDYAGFNGHPADNACNGPLDNSEEAGGDCDDCFDNDGDGLTDYPEDTGCYALNDDNEVDAELTIIIDREGGADGRVVTDKGDIDCDGVNCTATFIRDDEVVLSASTIPLVGPSNFWSWSDPDIACAGNDSDCTVTMDRSRTITARFGIASPPPSHTLTVVIQRDIDEEGNVPDGKVITESGLINCDVGECQATFFADEEGNFPTVDLMAVPLGANSRFWQWLDTSSECVGSTPTCAALMDQDRTITARFGVAAPPEGETLTVEMHKGQDNLDANVSGSPGAIDCEPQCVEEFFEGETVTLTATTGSGTEFTGWSDPFNNICSGLNPVCTVTMDISRLIRAYFDAPGERSLNILIEREHPQANGTVESTNVSGIDCPTGNDGCDHVYTVGQGVTLLATPADNSYFWYWHDDEDGSCSGTDDSCDVTMNISRTVHAHFGVTPPADPDTLEIIIQQENSGADGRVQVSYGGIDCDSQNLIPERCREDYYHQPYLYVSADPAPGSVFTGWTDLSGQEDCRGTDPLCGFRMDSDKTLIAGFRQESVGPKTLTVELVPHGIDSNIFTLFFLRSFNDSDVMDNKLDCDMSENICSATYPHNTFVSLRAFMPEAGAQFENGVISLLSLARLSQISSFFWGWEDEDFACNGLDLQCSFVMNRDRHVKAHFGEDPPTSRHLDVEVVKLGASSGSVFALDPLGVINCGSNCDADFFSSTPVTLKANAHADSRFVRWEGACSGTADTCLVTMTGDKNVTAIFDDEGAPPLTECSDGIDNDDPEDDLADYPNDPGCFSPLDDDETDPVVVGNCPEDGPEGGCPACNDGEDNDGDGTYDWAGIRDDEGNLIEEPDLSCQGQPEKDTERGISVIEI